MILAGDFNDYPGRAVHSGLTSTFIDAWTEGGAGTGFTYSSKEPKSRIDYVFLAPTNAWGVLNATVLNSTASDHLPLVVELVLYD